MVAVERINSFLNEDELPIFTPAEGGVVGFTDAHFSWDWSLKSGQETADESKTGRDKIFALSHVNIKFPAGKLTAVCGATGNSFSHPNIIFERDQKQDRGNHH